MAVRGQERAILVGVELKSRSRRGADHITYTAEESLEELKALAESAGASVEDTIVQSREAPDSATLIGSGKLEQLRSIVAAQELDVVLFDSDLTPTQQRNLEHTLECKILDRTQLILDIFARRARTREGQLQVELAQLNYLLPRLTGRGVEMSRLGGGIGTRGPGETQLETDRRRIHSRIKKLSDQLEHVRSGRGIQRHQRQSVPLATIALVGYTNAGKSTLFNRLTGAEVLSDARMFATLDPTVRHVLLPSRRKVLMSDTVGLHPQSAHHAGKSFSRHARRGHRSLVAAARAWTHPLPTLPTKPRTCSKFSPKSAPTIPGRSWYSTKWICCPIPERHRIASRSGSWERCGRPPAGKLWQFLLELAQGSSNC